MRIRFYSKFSATMLLVCVLVGGVVVAGGEDMPSPHLAESCLPHTTSGIRKSLHPDKPTSCYLVVMTCNYCTYDENGYFTGVEWEVCGICVGLSF